MVTGEQISGAMFYRGPSVLTGDPIVGVVTGLGGVSMNAKTGPMVQAWILHATQTPSEAVKSGADNAICGDCKLRGKGNLERTCYVTWWLGPMNVYRVLDMYPALKLGGLVGEKVRLGAYGDPAAIPFRVWDRLLVGAKGWIGYTHAWKTCDPRFRRLVMASVDSVQEFRDAEAAGWRTFRCRQPHEPLQANEIVCPASDEANHRVTCHQCQLCRGTSRPAKSVAIYVHGSRAAWFSPAVQRAQAS